MHMPDRTPCVIFVINSLTSGGAERVFVNLVNALRPKLRNYTTHLVFLDDEEHRHRPPSWTVQHCLDARFGMVRSTIGLSHLVRLLKPDVIISFLTRSNIAALVASRFGHAPCIISERVHTSSHLGTGPRAYIQRILIRATYPAAHRVIAVSESIRSDLASRYGVDLDRIDVVPNPIDVEFIRRMAAEEPSIAIDPDDILAAGRLTENKNFASLIKAFALSGLSGRLVIIGEGPLLDELRACARDVGLGDRVVLPGYVANPFPLLRVARAFASSSRVEGFPNAIVEALAVGCPIVATDCQSGPRDILQAHGSDPIIVGGCGILVPVDDARSMANGLRHACDTSLMPALVERGLSRAAGFSVAASVERYWSIIESAMLGRHPTRSILAGRTAT